MFHSSNCFSCLSFFLNVYPENELDNLYFIYMHPQLKAFDIYVDTN